MTLLVYEKPFQKNDVFVTNSEAAQPMDLVSIHPKSQGADILLLKIKKMQAVLSESVALEEAREALQTIEISDSPVSNISTEQKVTSLVTSGCNAKQMLLRRIELKKLHDIS